MQLLIVSGPDTQRSIALVTDGLLRVGRSTECAIQLADPTASRVHFELKCAAGRVWLRDANSRFGTFVNEVKTFECELRPGDVIRVGETTLRIDVSAADNRQTLLPASHSRDQLLEAGLQATTVRDPLEVLGQRFARFEVQSLLAKSNRGCLFRARDCERGETVALKIYKPVQLDVASQARILRAVQVMRPLTHQHVVEIYDAGKDDQFDWMSSELIEGEDAASLIARIGIAGMLDWRNTLRLAIHVSRALVFAAQQNIVHRNITPRNILIRKADGCVKLGGLGFAKSLDKDSTLAKITTAGEIIGDLPYCSPEQASGAELDARSDIYNLGATCYALLTGRPPCIGRTIPETLEKIHLQLPESPRKFHLGVPDLLEGTVLRMIAKRPEDRFKRAADLLLDLERVAKYVGEDVASEPPDSGSGQR